MSERGGKNHEPWLKQLKSEVMEVESMSPDLYSEGQSMSPDLYRSVTMTCMNAIPIGNGSDIVSAAFICLIVSEVLRNPPPPLII